MVHFHNKLTSAMKSVVVLLVGLAVVVSGFQYTEEWEAWKKEHSRVYESDDIELRRHIIWESNMQFVTEHNAHTDEFGFTVEMNEFADLVSLFYNTNYIIVIVSVLSYTKRSLVSLPSCTMVSWVMLFLVITQLCGSQNRIHFLKQLIGGQRELYLPSKTRFVVCVPVVPSHLVQSMHVIAIQN